MTSSDHRFHSLTEAIRRTGLADKNHAPRLRPLAGGVSSPIVRAETEQALFCVKQALPRLKVAQEWFAPVERNRAEVAWLSVAAQVFDSNEQALETPALAPVLSRGASGRRVAKSAHYSRARTLLAAARATQASR